MKKLQKSNCQFCEAELGADPEICPECGKQQSPADYEEDREQSPSEEKVFAKAETSNNKASTLETLENSLPWNGIFLGLMMIFLLLTFFNNK